MIRIYACAIIAVIALFNAPHISAAEMTAAQKAAPTANSKMNSTLEKTVDADLDAYRKKVVEAFKFNDFKKLELLEEEALSSSPDLLSNDTKLQNFHNGIYEAVDDGAPSDSKQLTYREKRFQAWMQTSPKSATAIIFYALSLKEHAWAIRGDGYSNTVSASQWREFREYLEKAENTLVSNKHKASVNPAWYSVMMQIVSGLNWSHDDYLELVIEATDRYPEYPNIYLHALNYMMPQWGGSFDMIEQFARSAVVKTKTKYGMAAYAMVYQFLGHYNSPGFGSTVHNLHTHLFEATKADWPSLKQGWLDVIARRKTQVAYNNYAWFACMANDMAATAAAFEEIKDSPDRSIWRPAKQYVACQRLIGIKPNYDIIFPELKESGVNTNIELYRKYLNAIDELFMGEEFERLEQIYAELNKEPKRFPSGEPVLVAFQQGIMDAMQRHGMDDAYWDALEQKLYKWRKAYPNSEVAHVMYGYQYLMRARHVMSGNNFYERLFQNALATFGGGYLNNARDYLQKVKDLSNTNAIWPLAMLEIGNLQQAPRSEMEAWLSEAIKRGPYQWIVYFCGMREMMQTWKGPRFMDELEQHANRAVESTKELEGQALYALVYRELFLGDKSINLFSVTNADWPRMKQGFEDLNSRYPSQWNLNNFAFFACMAKDKDKTRALLKQIGNKTIYEVWNMVPATYYRCAEWAKTDD